MPECALVGAFLLEDKCVRMQVCVFVCVCVCVCVGFSKQAGAKA